MPTFSLAQKHADLDHHNAALLLRIAQETGDTPIDNQTLSLLGDPDQLRGIPALARGISGAIHGSRPGIDTDHAPR